MKNLVSPLYYLINLLIEIIYYICYPILRLVLPFYDYAESITADSYCEDHPILIHAASVGEINAITPLARHLMDSDYPIYINTITVTGRNLARRKFPGLRVKLAALDIMHLRKRQLARIDPRLILIVETEIWPNLMAVANQSSIPILFVNARISEKSLRRYKLIKPILSFVSGSVQGVLAQSEVDRKRFDKLWDVKAVNAGNLKYCLNLPDYDEGSLRNKLGIPDDDFIITWGSSRPGEEELIITMLGDLSKQIPRLKLILAPRHPKRTAEVEKLLIGTRYEKYSSLKPKADYDVLLIDVLGHLSEAYAISDIVIIGGSFFDFGGHNPLEAAFYSKPVIIGKHHSSCKDSVQQLQKRDAILVAESAGLQKTILDLASNPDKMSEMGKRAKLVLTENARALDDHIKIVEEYLNDS